MTNLVLFIEHLNRMVRTASANEIEEMIVELVSCDEFCPNDWFLIAILERFKHIDIVKRAWYLDQIIENAKTIEKGEAKQCAI